MTSIIMTTSSGFTNKTFADWTKEQEKQRNQEWAAWNPTPVLEQVKTLIAKDARETKTYLKTDKETLKKRLYEYLYDNYFEFVGENQLTPEEYYEEFKRVIEDELKRTNKEQGFAKEMHSMFFKETLPQPFIF
jgi:hypothetical protein